MIRYPENAPISKELFEQSGVQAVLNECAGKDYPSIWQCLSKAARFAVENKEYSQGRILWLLADACSLSLKPASNNEPFAPYMAMEGKRSAISGDFDDVEVEFFNLIYPSTFDVKLRARIADLVWVMRRPRDRNAALAAIDAYREMIIDVDDWVKDGRKCWERALRLSLTLRTGAGSRKEEIEGTLFNALGQTTLDDGHLAIWISRVLEISSLEKDKEEEVAQFLEALANGHDDAGDMHRARDLYLTASEWYEKVGYKEKSAKMNAFAAEMWAKEALAREVYDEAPSYLISSNLYAKAIQAYRTIPQTYRDELNVNKKIDELRNFLREAGKKSLGAMVNISTDPIDISDMIKTCRDYVAGKDLPDALLLLANICKGAQVGKIKRFVKEQALKYPLRNLFGAVHMSSDGRVIAKSPSVSFGNEIPEEALWSDMVNHYIVGLSLVVQAQVWPALETIRLEHNVQERDFVFLAKQSPVTPLEENIL